MTVAYKDFPPVANEAQVTGDGKQPNVMLLNINVSCSHLPNLDKITTTDPMVSMQVKDPKTHSLVEVDRSEIIKNNLNPKFTHKFRALYQFEAYQPITFLVFNADSSLYELSKHDYIGIAETDLQTLMSNLGQPITLKILSQYTKEATMTVIAEQVSSSKEILKMEIAVKKLKRMHTFRRNKPYVIISRFIKSEALVPAYTTETRSGFSCTFDKFRIPVAQLCNNDLKMPVNFTVYDYNSTEDHKEIGSCTVTIPEMMDLPEINIMKGGESVGVLKFKTVQNTTEPLFIDYINDGLKINIIVAIDYSALNGDPKEETSYHYNNPNNVPNQYQAAIMQVGSILAPYDSNQKYPIYGFGINYFSSPIAVLPLSDKLFDTEVEGIAGLLEAYKRGLDSYKPAKSCYLAPVIKEAFTNWSLLENKSYAVILIFTQGIIEDMDETIDWIYTAARYGVSFIFVGIGNGNFQFMEYLDGDGAHKLVDKWGRGMKRDIVQFVPFSKYADNPSKLENEVLKELPQQICEFCMSKDYYPKGF